jgi:hypothetical protein
MNALAIENKQIERVDQLDKNFKANMPCFKNYIRNNAQITRTQAQAERMNKFNLEEENEKLIQERRSRQTVTSFSSRINPVNTFERLLKA